MAEARARTSIDRFVLLYALAWAGGTVAYTPFLTILLPVRVVTLAGPQAGVDWLASIALVGALAASTAGIVFGYLSDITRNRRGWIAGGLVLSCGLLIATERASTLGELVVGIALWQLSLNMMLGPLAALAGDVIPDDHKGMLGGLMAFAPGVGALSGALATLPGLAVGVERLWLVAGLVALCVVPVLLVPSPRPGAGALASGSADSGERSHGRRRAPAIRMWLARLAVQVAEATMFAYLYLWLLSLDSSMSDNQAARLFSLVMVISAPLALAAGRWSDRVARPIAPLRTSALVASIGLFAMATVRQPGAAMAAFGLFGLASAVFLALHSAQTLRILPRADRRGRDLGLFNLANTAPSLVMPWLALALVPLFGFPGLFLLLAVLAATASLLLAAVARTG